MRIILENGKGSLRIATEEDLDFITTTEHLEENRLFISIWTKEQHKKSLQDTNMLYLIVESEEKESIGYVMLCGLENEHKNIELMRVVITRKNKGYGRAVLRAIKEYVFTHLKAHRLWLDVKDFNERAYHLYKTEGFVEEGKLRECIRSEENYQSLIILSLLEQEYKKGVSL